MIPSEIPSNTDETITMGSSEDRLSDLSDDLLLCILYFVPSKQAAYTSLLSRRWGSLWRSSGAVNLVVQAHDYLNRRYQRTYSSYEEREEAAFLAQEAFVDAAKTALDAAEVPVTRLTLHMESRDGESTVEKFLCDGRGGWCTDDANVVSALVSHQAARRVEELRVAAVDVSSDGAFLYLEKENYTRTAIYGLARLASSDTLRVLDLTRCTLTTALALPRLTTLRLRYCAVEPELLQALLDAAPELTTVRLESLFFLLPNPEEFDLGAKPAVLCLSFQAVTTLVLSLCGKEESGYFRRSKSSWAIEIDAPRLQSFRYKGLMRRFRLQPAAGPGVARVDLRFLRDYDRDNKKETRRVLFWQFLRNFTSARTLKLKVGNDDLKDIVTIGEALQCAFPSLERLELEGMHRLKIKTAAAAIANLLHCCPALGEITLKLDNTMTALPDKDPRYGREFFERKDRLDYSKSIHRFVRQKGSKTALDCVLEEVPDIPGLSGRSFACLQRTLRRVSLQFRLDNNSMSNFLGLRLIKFFASHASVLEEICVDSGNWRLNEHLSFNVGTQMALAPARPISATASSIQNKDLADSSSDLSKNHSASIDSTKGKNLDKSTVGFMVLPLQRQTRMDCKS